MANAYISNIKVNDQTYLVKDAEARESIANLKTSDLNNDAGFITVEEVPQSVDESTVAGWGFTKTEGTYSKPEGGIPKADFTESVQTSLGKADTALQAETDPTVPAWAKEANKPSYTPSEVGALPSDTHIPSTLAELTDSATGRLVSDTEKAAWNGKVDKVDGSSLISSTDLAQITTNKNAIATLSGSGEGSIDKMIDAKINTWAAQVSDDNTINTYKEAIDWIATHGSEYTALVGEVDKKVDSVEGKGLSTNDFTTDEKTKLAGIAAGATAVSESTVAGWGFTKNTGNGTYSKPEGGIPKTDLASSVQASLGLADTALQSHQDISGKSDVGHKHTTADITDFPTIPTVSDTYSATSSEAMSGKAIASALSGVDGNVYVTKAQYAALATPVADKVYFIN